MPQPLNLLFQILQFERQKIPNKYPIEFSNLLYKLRIGKILHQRNKKIQTPLSHQNSLSKHNLI